MILVHFHGKSFSIAVVQVYAPTSDAKKPERFYEDRQDLLELTSKRKKKKKDDSNPIHHRDWNTKVGSQEMPGITGKFGL